MEKLEHPNIATLYEAFDTHKQVFLIMEYVSGGSLYSYLKAQPNKRLPESQVVHIFRQVVLAIAHCHSLNITHRDIKLENILMNDTQTRIKLIDFGFSTRIPSDRQIKIFCGTPNYMAPEIVLRKEYTG